MKLRPILRVRSENEKAHGEFPDVEPIDLSNELTRAPSEWDRGYIAGWARGFIVGVIVSAFFALATWGIITRAGS